MTDRALEGTVALVTGAGRSLGAAIALRLAADGADVAITYARSGTQADALVEQIRTTGRRAIAIRADGASAAEVEAAVQRTVEELGGLNILVNNAGGSNMRRLGTLSVEEIDEMLDVNLRGTILATRAALPHLGDGGRIITIGSVNAERIPFIGSTIYAAAKAGVVGFSKALARELGAKGVTVNVVQPGPIDTEGNPADGKYGDAMAAVTTLGRFGTVDEITALVSFLAGPESSYITGAVLTADGGFTA